MVLGRIRVWPRICLAIQAGNATGELGDVNAAASRLSGVGTSRGSGGSWRRLGHAGRRAGRARCRSCAACRRYPSAADRNCQGGNTTEQRELGPGLSFHLTSLSRIGPFATIRGTLLYYTPLWYMSRKSPRRDMVGNGAQPITRRDQSSPTAASQRSTLPMLGHPSGEAQRTRPTLSCRLQQQAASPTKYDRSEYGELPVNLAIFSITLCCNQFGHPANYR
jgi:hypothetical protein